VDQYINNSQIEPLWTLLANPANDAYLYANNLQALVNDFPQSGILQALLAHTSDEKNLRHASVYFNAKSLYKLINSPSAFTEVSDEKIIIQTGIRANGHYQKDEHQEAGEVLSIEKDENIDHDISDKYSEGNTVIETGPVITEDHLPVIEHETVTDTHYLIESAPGIEENTAVEDPIENKVTEINEEVPQVLITPNEHELINDATAKEDVPIEATDENRVEGLADAPAGGHAAEPQEPEAEKGISDEVFDEIVGIEHINIEPEANRSVAAIPGEEISVPDEPIAIIDEKEAYVHDEKDEPLAIIDEEEEKIRDEKDEPLAIIDEEEEKIHDEKAEPSDIINNGEEKLIKDNIVSSDIFTFDRAFGENKPLEQVEDKPDEQIENESLELSAKSIETTEVNSSVTDDTNHKDVSKYNDEQMPYTFMWWLDKTRREHAGTYQPYVKPEAASLNDKPKKATDELQQQYFENIFHITSVDELDKSTAPPAVPFDIKRKEHKIIERFIKEEPQIKPQSSDKLDNENKAKKSSEDRDELVTETLAAIYSDQMLYHKAIASYKKLILKFPEKSRYFAGKIEQLEKKTS
jgi:hypothetical protein